MNYSDVLNEKINNLKEYIKKSNLKSLVLGVSGGIDSTVVAYIAHMASKESGIPFYGISMPTNTTAMEELNVSLKVGNAFCSTFYIRNIEQQYQDFKCNLVLQTDDKVTLGNIKARLRMIHLYYLAGATKGMVLDTGNLTEKLLGFFTLHGDVGDYGPLLELTKTEVYKLAEECANRLSGTGKDAVLESIALTPQDGLGISKSDVEQFGVNSYDEVDNIIFNNDKTHPKYDVIMTKVKNNKYKSKLPIVG